MVNCATAENLAKRNFTPVLRFLSGVQSDASWAMTPYTLTKIYQTFGTKYCSHLHTQSILSPPVINHLPRHPGSTRPIHFDPDDRNSIARKAILTGP